MMIEDKLYETIKTVMISDEKIKLVESAIKKNCGFCGISRETFGPEPINTEVPFVFSKWVFLGESCFDPDDFNVKAGLDQKGSGISFAQASSGFGRILGIAINWMNKTRKSHIWYKAMEGNNKLESLYNRAFNNRKFREVLSSVGISIQKDTDKFVLVNKNDYR